MFCPDILIKVSGISLGSITRPGSLGMISARFPNSCYKIGSLSTPLRYKGKTR